MVEDIYGFPLNNIDALTIKLAEVLGANGTAHDSAFWGDYYLFRPNRDNHSEEKLRLCPNYVDEEEDWNMPDHTEYPVLLYVWTDRSAEIKSLLKTAFGEGITLLHGHGIK